MQRRNLNPAKRLFTTATFRSVAGLVAAMSLCCATHCSGEDWPWWRGPRLDGTSLEKEVPVHWSSTSNIVWKAPVPGEGHSSPIIYRDRIFLLSSNPDTQERLLVCFSRVNGELSWQKPVLSAPLEPKHVLNSYASSTPACDGQRVYAAFLDRDQMLVAAYDLSGQLLWSVHPGTFTSRHGFCSSPLLYEDKVLVNGDHDGDSYLVALSRADGKTLWKTPRQNHTRSYCTPLIRELAGKPQMVLSGDKSVASYDPRTGKQLWLIDGPTEQFVASPVYHEPSGLVLITGGFPDHHILAIRPDGMGNVTKTHIAWRTTEGAAYVPSPICEGDYFLVVEDGGIAHCFNARTGELAWKQRLGEQHASLVSAEGNVYFLNDKGVTHVVRPGQQYTVVATNELGEKCFASPAISRGQIFIRTDKNLVCVGKP